MIFESPARDELANLDRMSYEKKLVRWKSASPTSKGVNLSSNISLRERQIRSDGFGNIWSMPELIGRPCFGIPTARLRHGYAKHRLIARMGKRIDTSRCSICKVRPCCMGVVKDRLKVAETLSDNLHSAMNKWRAAGGLEEEGFAKAYHRLGDRGWRAIWTALRDIPFTSSNDEAVAVHWKIKIKEAFARKNRAFKKAEIQKRKEGDFNARRDLRWILDDERSVREKMLEERMSAADCPRYLKRLTRRSIERIGAVWWGQLYQINTAEKTNDSAIATTIIQHQQYTKQAHSSLRQAVHDDRKRIKKLESNAGYNGGVAVWPQLKI